MSARSPTDPLSEPRLNELLRQTDWRFLLRQRETPRTLDLRDEASAEALGLVTQAAPRSSEAADLVVLGFPSRAKLRLARESLRRGGEVVCLWRKPHPLGVRRARARLERAGFVGARFYWPGPDSAQAPEFWLPIDAPAAVEHVLSRRPPHSRRQAALRMAWHATRRAGALAPICAVARLPTRSDGSARRADAIEDILPTPEPWLLLTGGTESDNKVVGLPFLEEDSEPALVAKFARGAKAGAALDREAELLERLERERDGLPGVPWLRASGTRAGGRAIVQDAMHGRALDKALTASSYAEAAPRMTRWLGSLAGGPEPQPRSAWLQRLVSEPLDELEREFSDRLPPDLPRRARQGLAELGDLPLVWEHRDLGPWNVVMDGAGTPAVIDWEDAEPSGLPGLDLVYFLATSALLVDGALDDTSQTDRILGSYGRLLDPGTALGRVFSTCVAEYGARLEIDDEDLQRLRLLCWIVQSLIANRRLAPGAAGDYFIHLAEDELRRLESTP